MTVNLAWRDALAEVGGAFTVAEHAAGWTEAFTPWQIATLQRPWKPGDLNGRRACRALNEELVNACRSGGLRHTTTTTTDCVKAARFVTPPELNLGAWPKQYTRDSVRYGYTEKAVFKDTEHQHITAEAFAAWLAANEIEPSRHVAAWFKAQAVNNDSRPIAPPAEWKAQSPHGLQRLDTTDAGRLVRLADLVQWLMDTRELPCKTAVEQVCSTLEQRPSAAAGWLCLLTESGYAKPVTNEDSFFWVADPLSFWDTPPQVPDTDKGLAGAIKHMREYWGQSPAPGTGKRMGQHVLDPLAIRIDAAHLLWGYGRRVEAIEQTQAAAPAAPVVAAPAEKRRVLKTKALIAELEHEWPGIKSDISEASRNGLKETAHAGKGWDVEHAKTWADSKGKLKKPAQVVQLQQAWTGKVTTHRI